MELKPDATRLPITPEMTATMLAARCQKDAELASRLRENPKATLGKMSGKKLPDRVKVVIHENRSDHLHVAIPTEQYVQQFAKAREAMSTGGDTLTDEQLEKIAGGEIIIAVIALVTGGSLAVAVGVGLAVSETHRGS